MTSIRDPSRPAAQSPTPWQLAAIIATLTMGVVVAQTSVTLILWALDGVLALVIIAVATLSGCALLHLFRLERLQFAWRCMLATGLGLGFLSLLVLGCGVCGCVGADRRLVPVGILALAAVLGLRPLARWSKEQSPPPDGAGRLRWMIVTVAPFAALAMLVASLPPGILWQEEGLGYDVLEYHLQLPREYYEAGTIGYLPHNVYANFPSAAEMLYLFTTITTGEVIESWSVSKCLNALLGGLFVAAAYFAARARGARCGVVTAVVAASAPWVVYLSGVAYVENGLLLMGMLSAGCAVQASDVESSTGRRRWVLLAGVLSGLACGFKYTGAVMIALPVLVLLVILPRVRPAERLTSAVCFAAAALLSLSPWAIKNTVMTGNPVFPLASERFISQPVGWGPDEAERFAASHAPGPEEESIGARWSLAWRHIVADPPQRFGAILLSLALVALLRRRQRFDLAVAAMLVAQFLVWLLATHLYARFAVPMLIPLVLLAGRGAVDRRGQVSAGFVGLILVGIGFNLFHTYRLYKNEHIEVEGASVVFTKGIVGSYRHLATVNHELPEDAHILLVGDARPFYFQRKVTYCVVFNRNPFAEVVATAATIEEVIDWLRTRGYTHVLAHWSEMHRLRTSRYGLWEVITPSLFEQLQDASLQRLENYIYPEGQTPYATLYKVPEG